MKLTTLEALFFSELRNLYDAEKQILKVLPKMQRAASSPALKKAFETHGKQTENQVNTLKHIFDAARMSPLGVENAAIEGLIEEAQRS